MNPKLRAEGARWLAAWGLELGEEQWGLLDRYIGDVLEYGRKTNLSAARTERELLRRHCLDSLAALAPLKKRLQDGARLLDLGAGAGFIGICLKIAWPQASVTLMESTYRKFRFLNWASARLGIAGLHVLQARAEPEGRSGDVFDAVLARALAPLPEALRLARPLAGSGGLIVLYQSGEPDPADPELLKALAGARARLEEAPSYTLPEEKNPRHLLVLRGET